MTRIDEKGGWKRFQRLRFDSKSLRARARRAETATSKHAHRFIVKKIQHLNDVRQYITRWLALMAILIIATAVQLMWNQRAYQVTAPVRGGAYAEAVQGTIQTLNPLYVSNDAEESASALVFSGLMKYDTSGHLTSDLASNIAVDSTGEQYTVTLRSNLHWQDGRPLTAKDVVFTVNLMKNPATRSNLASSWQSITAQELNSSTVKFTLPAPYAAFQQALTFAVLPEHILGTVEPAALRQNTFSMSPVGSGPYKVTLLQSNPDGHDKSTIYLASWDNYYGKRPMIPHFELHAFHDQKDIIGALKNGEVIAAAGLDGDAKLPKLFKEQTYPIDNGVYALFNNQSPVLKDQSVRKALQLGTNTTDLRKAISPRSPSLDTPFVSSQFPAGALPSAPSVDVAAANQLLEKDGWTLPAGSTVRKKGDQTLTLNVTTVNNSDYENIVENLTNQWKKLGVGVTKKIYNPNDASQNFVANVLQPRAYDVLVYQLVIGSDPDVYAYWHSSQANAFGYNLANYQNGISDDVLSSARGQVSYAIRLKKYETFAGQWLQDAPALGLYQSVLNYAHTSGVSALSPDSVLPSAVSRYSDVSDWTAKQATVYKTP